MHISCIRPVDSRAVVSFLPGIFWACVPSFAVLAGRRNTSARRATTAVTKKNNVSGLSTAASRRFSPGEQHGNRDFCSVNWYGPCSTMSDNREQSNMNQRECSWSIDGRAITKAAKIAGVMSFWSFPTGQEPQEPQKKRLRWWVYNGKLDVGCCLQPWQCALISTYPLTW